MGKAERFHGWRMVAICFLIMNCALGANFSAYGALVEAIQHHFQTSRALASMGISMLTLALGLLAPFVGGLTRRMSIRTLILIGLTLNGGGFLLLTQVHSITVFLAIYGLIIGPGFALAGVVPCAALISNWFSTGRGRALGIINIPLGNALLPLAAAALMTQFGLSGALAGNGLLLLALIPLAALIIDSPQKAGQLPLGGFEDPLAGTQQPLSAVLILRSPRFAVLTLGIALLSAAGIVMVTHLVPLAIGRGVSIGPASLLLSVFGLAGLVGAPLFGWLSDKIGAGSSLAVLALLWIPCWLSLIVVGNSLALLLALAFLIGLFSNGILTLFGVLAGAWLGPANVGLGMGLCYFFQIPFMFAAAPLAGAMFDHFGSYTPTILLHVATFVLIGVTFLLYRPKGSLMAVSASPPLAA
jgi:MFS family permease